MKTKLKESTDLIVLNTPEGRITYGEEVVQSLTKSLVMEVPGVCDMKLLPFLPTKSSKVQVSPGASEDAVSLSLTVCLQGGQNLRTICEEIQSRIHHYLPLQLGILVEEVNVRIESVKYLD